MTWCEFIRSEDERNDHYHYVDDIALNNSYLFVCLFAMEEEACNCIIQYVAQQEARGDTK